MKPQRKLKVAVLVGGRSAEHDISVASGREVIANLDENKYDLLPVYISRDGRWNILPSHKMHLPPSVGIQSRRIETLNKVQLEELTKNESQKIVNHKPDIVFIALHGPFGEDGTVQGMLELLGIPYTGSGVLTSALGMDKIASRKIFEKEGLKVPRYNAIKEKGRKGIVWKNFAPPVFVKPANLGSSIGGHIVHKKDELDRALEEAYLYSEIALVEEYLDGIEVTCAILGNHDPVSLPLVEIRPKNEFFDFEAKYNQSKCEEIVPAQIPVKVAKKTQEIALLAYKSIGCRAFARVDMIIKDGDPHILEINTIPGLTSVSLVPKAAKAAGISYPQLLDKIIKFSLSN